MVIKAPFPRLNVGCGRMLLPEWTNVDYHPWTDPESGRSVDALVDLDNRNQVRLPFNDDSFDEVLMAHVLEHIHYPLPLLQDLWRVTVNGGLLGIRCPYGSTDDAWEDPTHVRPYFVGSWRYFSQPLYWRANYGYTADWEVVTIKLQIDPQHYDNCRGSRAQLEGLVRTYRNVVQEQIVELMAIKPARQPDPQFVGKPMIHFVRGV